MQPSLSLRCHAHAPFADRLMYIVHGNTLGVSKSSSDWLDYTGFPGDVCVVFFNVSPGNKEAVMPNPLTKEESRHLYNRSGSRIKIIERVPFYKYLGIWIDDKLLFNVHIANLIRKLKLKLGFYFRNKSNLTFNAKNKLVEATFLTVLDYGDILFKHAASSILTSLDSVYHASLCLITNAKSRTHHCILYEMVGWTSLAICRKQHWYIFIYKAMLGKLPAYLCTLLCLCSGNYQLRSSKCLLFNIPRVCTELGKTAFICTLGME